MTIRVAWSPSTDPNIASYNVQSSPDESVWTQRINIVHNTSGPNYDPVVGVFFWDDATGLPATWYRINAVDSLGQTSVWSPAFQATGGYIPRWETVQQIVSSAALDVGLGDAGPDVMNSSDANILQMCGLLKTVGRILVKKADWQHLRKEYTFTTVAGQGEYPLPVDFHNMIDQTWWNRTNRLPVGGPMSGQEWQYLRARMVNVVFNVLFRTPQRQIVLYPPTNTPGGYEIAFEYNSGWWISHQSAPDTPVGDAPTASTDYVWFDPLLAVQALKLAFLKAKGFDTTAAQQDYQEALTGALDRQEPAPVLNATRRFNPILDPLIGGQSVPVTGFGT